MASCPSFVPWARNRGDFDIDKAPWELYKIDEDFSQANDLAV
jgi:arylsulfatase